MLDNGFYDWLKLFEAEEKREKISSLQKTFDTQVESIDSNLKSLASNLLKKNDELGGFFLSDEQKKACADIAAQGLGFPELIKPYLTSKFQPTSDMIKTAYSICWSGTDTSDKAASTTDAGGTLGLKLRPDLKRMSFRGKTKELGEHEGIIKAEYGKRSFSYAKDFAEAFSSTVKNMGPGNLFVTINDETEKIYQIPPETEQELSHELFVKKITFWTDSVAKYDIFSQMASQTSFKIKKPFPEYATKFIFIFLEKVLAWVSPENIENVENFKFEDYYDLILALGGKSLRASASKPGFHDTASEKAAKEEKIKSSLAQQGKDVDDLYSDDDLEVGDEIQGFGSFGQSEDDFDDVGEELQGFGGFSKPKEEEEYEEHFSHKLKWIFDKINTFNEVTEEDLTARKEKLLNLAKQPGSSPPIRRTPLGNALYAIAHNRSRFYDPAFAKQIFDLRPDWQIKQGSLQQKRAKTQSARKNLAIHAGKARLVYSLMNFFVGCFANQILRLGKEAALARSGKGKTTEDDLTLKKVGRQARKVASGEGKSVQDVKRFGLTPVDPSSVRKLEDEDEAGEDKDRIKEDLSDKIEKYFMPELYRCLKQTQQQAASLLTSIPATKDTVSRRFTVGLVQKFANFITDEIDTNKENFITRAKIAFESKWFEKTRRQWPVWFPASFYEQNIKPETDKELFDLLAQFCTTDDADCSSTTNPGLRLKETITKNSTLKENLWYNLGIAFEESYKIYQILQSGSSATQYKLTHNSNCGQIFLKTTIKGSTVFKQASPEDFPYDTSKLHHKSKLEGVPEIPKAKEKTSLYSPEDEEMLNNFASKLASEPNAEKEIKNKNLYIKKIKLEILDDNDLAAIFQYDLERITQYVYGLIAHQFGLQEKPSLDSPSLESPSISTPTKPPQPTIEPRKIAPPPPSVAIPKPVVPSTPAITKEEPAAPKPVGIIPIFRKPVPSQPEIATTPAPEQPPAPAPSSNLKKFLDILNKAKQGRTP